MLPDTTTTTTLTPGGIRYRSDPADEQIRRRTEERLCYYASHRDEIDRRLRELDTEWDLERTLVANASSLSLFGFAMGALGGRRWLLLPLAVQSFLLQHGLQGWCPPLPLLRRAGVRTRKEIEVERYALLAIRGDFGKVLPDGPDEAAARVPELLAVVREETV